MAKSNDDKGLLIRQYPQGVKIFEAGEGAHEAYFIKEGGVRIYKTIDGTEQQVGEAVSGDVIGEMALLTGRDKHTATAEAMERSTIVVITKDVLKEKLDKADPLLSAMINMLIKRLYKRQET